MRIAGILMGLLIATATFAQSIVTPVFVHKDGDASTVGYTGSDKDIVVDGGSLQTVGWITFQTQGIDFSKTGSAKLTLYVKSVGTPGTLQIRLLTAGITAPENNMRLADIPADAAIATSIALGTADVEKVIQLDLTASLKAGTFKGVALTSDDGLSAAFDSREGLLAPVIFLTHNVDDAAAKWLSGTTAPENTLGKNGDFYLNTTSGDVSAKASGAWGVVSNVTGPAGAAGAKGDKGDQGLTGAIGATGAQGPKGDKGDKGDQGVQGLQGIQGIQGPIGLTGAAGTNGISITWLGSFTTAPSSPSLNQAYHNSTDGNSYIYNGSSWALLAQKGDPGTNTITDTCGNVYHTVRIGNQEWTVENLRTTKYNDGTPITLDTGTATWGTGATGKYCWYGNDSTNNKVVFGALYNWYVVNTGKLAPAGWRVPDTTDWNILENYLISHGYNWDGTTAGNKIAKSIAARTEWSTSTSPGAIGNNLNRNNRSEFSALGGGYRDHYGEFSRQGYNGYWWSATKGFGPYAWLRGLSYGLADLYRGDDRASFGFSVRLVRDLN